MSSLKIHANLAENHQKHEARATITDGSCLCYSVEFSACISCSNILGLTEALNKENIETIRWGQKLTLLMQNGRHVLTI